jgi:hypothetical protein
MIIRREFDDMPVLDTEGSEVILPLQEYALEPELEELKTRLNRTVSQEDLLPCREVIIKVKPMSDGKEGPILESKAIKMRILSVWQRVGEFSVKDAADYCSIRSAIPLRS